MPTDDHAQLRERVDEGVNVLLTTYHGYKADPSPHNEHLRGLAVAFLCGTCAGFGSATPPTTSVSEHCARLAVSLSAIRRKAAVDRMASATGTETSKVLDRMCKLDEWLLDIGPTT
jgi:hypothetical protein